MGKSRCALSKCAQEDKNISSKDSLWRSHCSVERRSETRQPLQMVRGTMTVHLLHAPLPRLVKKVNPANESSGINIFS